MDDNSPNEFVGSWVMAPETLKLEGFRGFTVQCFQCRWGHAATPLPLHLDGGSEANGWTKASILKGSSTPPDNC